MTREFHDIRRQGRAVVAKEVEEFMAELSTLQSEICTAENMRGRRSPTARCRRSTCDASARSTTSSQHFAHWLQNLADEPGALRRKGG